jgi:hypothetical protein
MDGFRGATALLVAAALGLSTIAAPASAAIVGTEQMLAQSVAQQRVAAFLARAEVVQQLQDWGVDAADAQQRIAALTDAELNLLAQKIDTLPAGAGLLEVIGIVFVVLLILELVGVINIFTRI